jgi:hypothetical protein
MWVTLFGLAVAASVWFSAASLALQLEKKQADVNAAIERREQMSATPYRQLSAAQRRNGDRIVVQLDRA